MQGLWEDLKHRKIVKAATIYAAVTWGFIQIADVLVPVLGFSEQLMSSLVLLGFTGFPVALVIGWMRDIQIERNERRARFELALANGEPISPDTSGPSLNKRLVEAGIIVLFGAGAGVLYFQSSQESATRQASPKVDLLANQSTQSTQALNNLSNPPAIAIAVLPFANFSDSSEVDFFADGLSEELLNVLARNKQFRVAARTSSFQYKNTNINIKTIGKELGVQYVLEGSVRRSGDLIRITAQLINAEQDVHIFSKSWDRTTANVFKVQDEIAQSVMQELKVNLLGDTFENYADIGTSNIDSFAAYSKGLSLLRNRNKEDFEQSMTAFDQALLIDPGYADAMAMKAEVLLLQVTYGFKQADEVAEEVEKLLQQALSINPELASGHAVKGLMYWLKDEMQNSPYLDQAIEHFQKALAINPSYAEAYMWYGSVLQGKGNFYQGGELRKKAFEIDPLSAVAGFNRAQDLIRMGDYKGAMNVFNTVVRNNPNYSSAYAIAGDVSFAVGQLDQAYSMYSRLSKLSSDDKVWLINSSKILIPLGLYERAQENISKLQSENHKGFSEKFDWLQASLWLASGQNQSFYQWVDGFNESTEVFGERLWRGFAALKQSNWRQAIDDLESGLELMRRNNPDRVDEMTVRTQLFLAKAYQSMGEQLTFERYLSQVEKEIESQQASGVGVAVLRNLKTGVTTLKGQQALALVQLRQSIQEGFVDFWWTEVDPVFASLVVIPEFAAVKDEHSIRMKLMLSSIESQHGISLGR